MRLNQTPNTQSTQNIQKKNEPELNEPETPELPEEVEEVEEHEGNYSRHNRDHGGFMTVLIIDKDSMEAEVTISLINPEVTWTARGWISEDNTLELFDKDYPACQANLTFKNGQIEIETSDAEEWDEVLGEARLDGTYAKEK